MSAPSLPNLNPQTIVRSTATVFGLLGTAVGIQAILDPFSYSKNFGLPSSTSSNPFVRVIGGRTLAGGLTTLALVYFKADRALGASLVIGLVTGAVDGAVVRGSVEGADGKSITPGEVKAAKSAAMGHWVLTGVAAGLGVWLLSVS
ncbi:hypothetical protein HK097_010811 [Rhizophlyctis rosea]|uniref:Uncharacterized protein n=1 Tax=Rhizophlyctis rosea TaxID=64517 RepID=A0AAD5S9U0_9FUNG|nr:hypothetical protein HK097_010811 [Rhizophlyctis rosea]